MTIRDRQSQAGFGDATVLIGVLFLLVFIIVIAPWRGVPKVKPPPLPTNAPPVLPVEYPGEDDPDPWFVGQLSRPPVPSALETSPIPYNQMSRELLAVAARRAICINGRESL